MKYVICLVAVVAVCCMTGCSFTSTAKDFNGLTFPEGTAKAHISTGNIAVHILFSKPIWGDATLNGVVSDCTKAAKTEGASRIRIVQSDVTTFWWIFPPISFVIHPVWASTAADVF